MSDIVRADIRAGIAHKPEVRCIRRSHRFRLCPVIAVVRELRLRKRLYLSRRLAGQNLLPAQDEQVEVRRPAVHAARQRQLRRRIDKQCVRGLRRSHFLRKHLRPPLERAQVLRHKFRAAFIDDAAVLLRAPRQADPADPDMRNS